MKKILGISASCRKKGGETEKSLDYCLDLFDNGKIKTKKIVLGEKQIGYCISCDFCKKNPGECSILDDTAKILEEMRSSDVIIFASPVYFGLISGVLKALMDRTLTLRRDNFALKDKICSGIAVGRSRNGGQELVLNQIQTFANIQGMIYVGDDNHFGGTVAGDLQDDDFGKKTIEGLSKKIKRILS